LANMYIDTEESDLHCIEVLKKASLEVLDDDAYKLNPDSAELTELYAVLTQVPALNPVYVLEPTAGVLHCHAPIILAGLALGDVLRKQLIDDIAALRRISRVEGYQGVDCKALIQSGKIYCQ